MADIMDLETNATAAALVTPEILEMILCSLPPIKLLQLQRTCQLWNAVISTSPQLQRNLFMRPDWRLECKINDPKRTVNVPGERPRNNLMLRPVLGGMYPAMTLKMVDGKSHNPFLVEDAQQLDDEVKPTAPDPSKQGEPLEHGFWAWDISVAFPADKLPTSPTTAPAIHYEHASWRKMYLSQPPATSLHLCKRWQRASNPALTREEGITMGEFVDKARKARDHWNPLYIASDRDWHFEGGIKFSHFEG